MATKRLKWLPWVVLEYFFSEVTTFSGNKDENVLLLSPLEEPAMAPRTVTLMLCFPASFRSERWCFLCLVHSADSHGDLPLPGKGIPKLTSPREEEVSSVWTGLGRWCGVSSRIWRRRS